MFIIKEKVFAIRISIAMVFITIIIAGGVNFYIKENPVILFIVSILLGINSSAFATMIIYAVEYNVEKIKALETYYVAFRHVHINFMNIEYLRFWHPLHLIKAYYSELEANNSTQIMLNQLPIGIDPPAEEVYKFNYTAKNDIENLIRPHFSLMFPKTSEEELNRIVNNSVVAQFNEYDKKINKAIDQYIALSNISYDDVNRAYGNIYFFIGNKKKKNEINNNLHEPQLKMLNEIRIIGAFYLKKYKCGESNGLAFIIDKVLEMQNKIFRTEVKDSKCYIYREYFWGMENRLEIFRANIYGQKPTLRNDSLSIIYPIDSV